MFIWKEIFEILTSKILIIIATSSNIDIESVFIPRFCLF